MIIYADILIFTNIIIDYILLTVTSYIIKQKSKLICIVVASLIGGVSSLYIFVDSNSLIIDILFKLISGVLLVFITFGFTRIKIFLIQYIIFIILSFSLNGLVFFIYNLKNSAVLSRNLVSYIDISPILLIVLSCIFYTLIRVIEKILNRKIRVDYAEITLQIYDKTIKLNALIDSGHTLTDPLSDSQIIFIDKKKFSEIISSEQLVKQRIRLIPVSTVSDSNLIEGIRCDTAEVFVGKQKFVLTNPIVLPANKNLGDTYNALISKSAINLFSESL